MEPTISCQPCKPTHIKEIPLYKAYKYPQLRCSECKKKTTYVCEPCSGSCNGSFQAYCIASPPEFRTCFEKHRKKMANADN